MKPSSTHEVEQYEVTSEHVPSARSVNLAGHGYGAGRAVRHRGDLVAEVRSLERRGTIA